MVKGIFTINWEHLSWIWAEKITFRRTDIWTLYNKVASLLTKKTIYFDDDILSIYNWFHCRIMEPLKRWKKNLKFILVPFSLYINLYLVNIWLFNTSFLCIFYKNNKLNNHFLYFLLVYLYLVGMVVWRVNSYLHTSLSLLSSPYEGDLILGGQFSNPAEQSLILT